MVWSALMASLPWQVNDQEMKKQQDEITAIMKMREASSSGTQQAGDFICTVYLEEKKTETEQHVKVSSWAGGKEGTGVPLLYVQASVVAWGLTLSWHLCGVRMEGP